MPKEKHTPEEIAAKLRQVDVFVSQGPPMSDAFRQIGVSEVPVYRWRHDYGGLKRDQVKRLKELALENARLPKAVSDLTFDKLILKETARETIEPRAAPGVYRALPARSVDLASAHLCRDRPEPIDTAQIPRGEEDEGHLRYDLVTLVREHGRLGFRKMSALLRSKSGWVVYDKRVERIWRQEGLRVPPPTEAEPELAR